MTDAATPIPSHVDVTPQSGRRVRTPDGSLLPPDHVLRGEPRSPYWIRAQQDGDVTLAPHEPEAAEPSSPVPPPPPAAAEPEKPGRTKP